MAGGIRADSLASPFTLGISAAAGFGTALAWAVAVAIIAAAEFIVPVNAFLMAMLTAHVFHGVSRMRGATVEIITSQLLRAIYEVEARVDRRSQGRAMVTVDRTAA